MYRSDLVRAPVEPIVEIAKLRKTLRSADGSTLEVNRDVNFSLYPGEFVAIVGPSGAGKTTLLKVIAGLLKPDGGAVRHRGDDALGIPSWLSLVFQEYNKSLLPWTSVLRNVEMPLWRLPRRERGKRAAEMLSRMGLDEFLTRYPWELSGGMQQRVAIARALVSEPELLLLDEPFASVDALTRGNLEDVTLELWSESNFTALLVTHDIAEAVYMASRVLVLSNRPATIERDIAIDLPRPRSQKETRGLKRFHELFSEVFDTVGAGG